MKLWDSTRCVLVALVLEACGSPPASVDAGQDATVEMPTPSCDLDGGTPKDVFCIGLYAGRDPTRYATSARPYTPGVTLWSDGAEKQRYLALPESSQIDTSDMDAWRFPLGTK